MRSKGAYDIAAFWARAGIAESLRTPGGPLPFQRGGMGDHSAAMTGAAMVSAALVERARTGQGQVVSTSLLRQGCYTIGFDLNVTLMWGRTLGIGVRETMYSPVVNNYTAGDGRAFWIVGLEGDRHWPALARAVGHPEWLTDERFATGTGRAINARELIGLLDEIFATRTARRVGRGIRRRARAVLEPGQLHRGRGGRRAVPGGQVGGRGARRAEQHADVGDAGRLRRRAAPARASGPPTSGSTPARSWPSSQVPADEIEALVASGVAVAGTAGDA